MDYKQLATNYKDYLNETLGKDEACYLLISWGYVQSELIELGYNIKTIKQNKKKYDDSWNENLY